jgi:hypothetical protein
MSIYNYEEIKLQRCKYLSNVTSFKNALTNSNFIKFNVGLKVYNVQIIYVKLYKNLKLFDIFLRQIKINGIQ